ncbi:MAG: POTRA domain-containing protein [Bacteroidota bacterium]
MFRIYRCVVILCFFSTKLFGQEGLFSSSIIYSTDVDASVADSITTVSVAEIFIEGNHKTRPTTIYRELQFAKGETYYLSILAEHLLSSKNALMRTGLFRQVSLSLLRNKNNEVSVSINVEERWYIFPMPFAKPVDYSFMEWVGDGNRSFNRINYGLRVAHRNFAGRNDKLHLNFVNGFTRQVGLQYGGFNLDKALKWTAGFNIQHGKKRAVDFTTAGNKRLAIHTANNDFVYSFYHAAIDISYRRAIKTAHSFGVSYTAENIADTVFKINADYDKASKNLRFVNFYYRLSYADVDIIAYPTKGRLTEITAIKKGYSHNVSLWQVSAKNSLTWPVGKNYIFNLRTAAMIKLPFDQPRFTKTFIGHEGMFMQGYEDYLIDGVAGGYTKASIARPLLARTIYAPKAMLPQKLQRFRALPFQLYVRGFINTGYVYDPQPAIASLSNKALCSAGIALDVVAFADWVIKIEWSLNLVGQNGLYLHPHNSF